MSNENLGKFKNFHEFDAFCEKAKSKQSLLVDIELLVTFVKSVGEYALADDEKALVKRKVEVVTQALTKMYE